MKHLLLLAVIYASCMSCTTQSTSKEAAQPIGAELKLQWAHLGNNLDGENKFRAQFTLSNHSAKPLPNRGWAIYFSQTPRRIIESEVDSTIQMEQISGDWYRIRPTAFFPELLPGETFDFAYTCQAWIIKEGEAPSGVYIVFEDETGKDKKPELFGEYTLKTFDQASQINRNADDLTPIPTSGNIFRENADLTLLSSTELLPLIPSPLAFQRKSGTINLASDWKIIPSAGLVKEAEYLQSALKPFLKNAPAVSPQKAAQSKVISLSLSPTLEVGGLKKDATTDAYHLNIEGEAIQISGTTPAAVFYGIQSLIQLIPIDNWGKQQESVAIGAISIEDAPRFAYRGIHFDVGRNFQDKASVLKLLDAMAYFKLNRFHFHLTDDEGWRLEIPDLPELVEIGAKRGHTLTEENMLHPAYGSGPFPKSNQYYSKKDFLEILRYAKDRHIEVIPEIDMPGHARAAIKAMRTRYQHLVGAGKEAEAAQYLLEDLSDESEYRSVQDYTDNVICVCQESTYAFLEKVVVEMKKMYEEAGAPLQLVHTGGDEVPQGVWEKSPACQKLNTELSLSVYFLSRFNELLKKHGLTLAGWEEVALVKNEQGVYVPNPDFVAEGFVPFVWNNLWGNQDLGNRLANAGYPIVWCNVTNLYFDLAYNKDPKEPGYYWGGFVDTKKAYSFVPEDIFKSTQVDPMGNVFDVQAFYQTMQSLSPQGQKNILGIQGQLWSETLVEKGMWEYYMLPKMMGLAERAWSPQPQWASLSNLTASDAAREKAWNQFANTLGQVTLHQLAYLSGGFDYRLPPPGAMVQGGMLYANTAFPGLDIRYTTDGSEPTLKSPLWEKPVAVQGKITLATFDRAGNRSLVMVMDGPG
ncbi:MAG TPA: family 20 glycosylhydrolase [Saprospiraceae bacterium]|nr:family 20 glycosylhydrolase [Saprospiraceae bacterium]HMQ82685.1 family 20 glycosylhydrolase [Saprospiraceae bacterium]